MHRVVIVGCGFAGLFAAKALRRAPVEVVVVDRTNHHLFQPLLYQVATGRALRGRHRAADPRRPAPPAQRARRPRRGRRHRRRRPASSRSTRWDATTKLSYDSLIVATGASQSYFGHDEYARRRAGDEDDRRRPRAARADLRRLRDGRARARRRRPRALADVRDRRRRADRRRAGRADRRAVAPRAGRQLPQLRSRGGADRPARRAATPCSPAIPERLRRRAQRDLERLGVEVRLGTRVVGVDATGLDVEGGRIEARTKIWAAGVQASPLGRLLADRARRHRRPLGPRRGAARLLAARAIPRCSSSAT